MEISKKLLFKLGLANFLIISSILNDHFLVFEQEILNDSLSDIFLVFGVLVFIDFLFSYTINERFLKRINNSINHFKKASGDVEAAANAIQYFYGNDDEKITKVKHPETQQENYSVNSLIEYGKVKSTEIYDSNHSENEIIYMVLMDSFDREAKLKKHNYGSKQYLFVLQGGLKVKFNNSGKSSILKPGQSLTISGNVEHESVFDPHSRILVVWFNKKKEDR